MYMDCGSDACHRDIHEGRDMDMAGTSGMAKEEDAHTHNPEDNHGLHLVDMSTVDVHSWVAERIAVVLAHYN